MASDPDEEFDIDIEASDLQLNSEFEYRRETYGLIQSQIPAQIHASEDESDYNRVHGAVGAAMNKEQIKDCGIIQN